MGRKSSSLLSFLKALCPSVYNHLNRKENERKITQILKKEKTTEDSLNIPTENKNPEMQLGMMAHLYNPST